MERIDFMHLLNQFKMDDVGTPPPADDDEEEDLPFTDIDEDEEDEDYSPPEDSRDGMSGEDILDYWENAQVPIKFCGLSDVIWDDGIAVRASISESGKAVLVWERIP